MIGLFIGAASGTVQFRMLSKFTSAVTCGALNVKAVLLGTSQFFLPLAVLLICALILPEYLMWSGIGMAAALTVCALASFITSRK